MPSHTFNNPNKIRKPTRPRLCDRRLAKKTHTTSASTPKYHLRPKPQTLWRRNPALALKISQMRLTIAPIVHVHTGLPAPDFPTTMLSLFTLTEPQLDALATYYSQTTSPSSSSSSSYENNTLRTAYPLTMDWSRACLDTDPALPPDCKFTDMERFKVKMRMFARFIGMRGAETPGWEVERQMQVLRKKVRWVVQRERVREEEEEEGRGKGWRGVGGL